jgi:hypothetical protein
MSVRLVATGASQQEFLRVMDALIKWPEKAATEIESEAGWYIRQRFKRNFSEEGYPDKWAQLRPRTIAERLALGFPPAHPILVRTGDLMRSVTQLGHARNASEMKRGRAQLTLTLSSSDPRFARLSGGADNMAARPMVVLSDSDLPGLDAVIWLTIRESIGIA